MSDTPPQPRSINPNLSAAFESIILTCLAKEPDDRYATAEDLRADLMRFRQGRAVAAQPFDDFYGDDPNATQALPRTQATRAMRADSTVAQPAVAPLPPEVKRRTAFYSVMLVVLLAVFGALIYLLARETGFIGEAPKQQVTVPSVVGDDRASAKEILENAGFTVKEEEEANPEDAEIVFAQNPEANSRVDKNSEVTIKVSTGPEKVLVPNVKGKQKAEAQSILEDKNFKVLVADRPDDNAPIGTVVDQNPAGGSEIDSGSSVTIYVSSGEKAYNVPNVVGKTEDDAVDTLRNDDGQFKVKTVKQASDTVASGKVISQDPAGGTEAAKGATVTITVSTGPEEVEVPDVVGKTENQAKIALLNAGFKVNTIYVATPLDNTDDGTVIDQNPNGGTKAEKGSTVDIRVADP